MADFIFKLDEEVAGTNGKGNGKVETDVHAVTVTNAFLGETANGNNLVDLIFETEGGSKGVIFGMCIDEKWKSGAENFDYSTWQELAVLGGMKTGDTYMAKRKMNGKEVEAIAFKELAGKKFNMAIYEEFDVYNGKETIKLKLSQTFTPSGKSLTEARENLDPVAMDKAKESLKPFYTKNHANGIADATPAGGQTGAETVAEDDSVLTQGGLFD